MLALGNHLGVLDYGDITRKQSTLTIYTDKRDLRTSVAYIYMGSVGKCKQINF